MTEVNYELEGDDEEFIALPDWSNAIFGRPREEDRRIKPGHLQTCDFPLCPDCGGPVAGKRSAGGYINPAMFRCETCHGIGYADPPVDDETWAKNAPGSEGRVVMLAARYAAGLDLWSGAPRQKTPEPRWVMDGVPSYEFHRRNRDVE